MTYNHYSAPTGFNFENKNNANRGGDYFETNKKRHHYNADKKSEELLKWIMNMSEYYKSESNNLFMIMGDDFTMMDAT